MSTDIYARRLPRLEFLTGNSTAEVVVMNRLHGLIYLMFVVISSFLCGPVCSGEETPALVDLFVSGSEGYHTYRIPAIITSRDGTLLAICEGRKTSLGDHGDLDLVLKRSTDGGRTWGPLQLVYEEGGDKKITIGNPCPVVDQQTGIIWLPFCRDNNEVLIIHSKDDGKTWSKPRNITSKVKKIKEWDWYATGPGNAIQLTQGEHKGRLLIPCDHRVKQGDSKQWGKSGRSHVFFSDDQGKTWQLGGVTDWAMNECAVVELADGSLMLNMRSYRGKGNRAVSTSRDGGLSWSPAVNDRVLIESICQASFIRYTLAEEQGKNRLLFSNPATKSGRHHLTVRMSYDEGKTWPEGRLLYEGSAAYSCLCVLPDGHIGIVFERDNYKKITFSRLTLDWLTHGHDSLKK